jgi:iodotyrosine deiodinase
MTAEPKTVPLTFERLSKEETISRAQRFADHARLRRSVRKFSTDPVAIEAVEHCIEAAAQSPSGANKQPWTFVLVTEPDVKRLIREACEREEAAFYAGRATRRWLDDLKPLGTTSEKPFLEQAPALIVVFAQRHGDERKDRHYYVTESVGIAVGALVAALHHVGLATVTYTPAPMKFLSKILGRPANESGYMVLPVGYPAPDCEVPDIERKPLDAVLVRP